MIPVESAPYQPCYCEENVYKLLELCDNRDGLFVVIVSNDDKAVTLWCQKSAPTEMGAVIWDYHVFVIHKTGTDAKVYDQDSSLAWGVSFEQYWTNTMKAIPTFLQSERFSRKFRVIPADIYLSILSSDRSHMKNDRGEYAKPPPEWPLINPHLPSNLMQLLRFAENFEGTEVLDEQRMVTFFST